MLDLPNNPILPSDVIVNSENDTVEVYGFRFSGHLFRTLCVVTPPSRAYRTVKAENGVITVETFTVGA